MLHDARGEQRKVKVWVKCERKKYNLMMMTTVQFVAGNLILALEHELRHQQFMGCRWREKRFFFWLIESSARAQNSVLQNLNFSHGNLCQSQHRIHVEFEMKSIFAIAFRFRRFHAPLSILDECH